MLSVTLNGSTLTSHRDCTRISSNNSDQSLR